MVRRQELSDAEWARLEPLLPARQTGGRPFHDHRVVLNGMLFRLHTGTDSFQVEAVRFSDRFA